LGNILGTRWELENSIVWTHWEAGENEIYISPPPLPPPQPQNIKGKEARHLDWMLWAFPLVAWNFSSQKTWSPFLAWANNPCK
jgi:hypothetical protein